VLFITLGAEPDLDPDLDFESEPDPAANAWDVRSIAIIAIFADFVTVFLLWDFLDVNT